MGKNRGKDFENEIRKALDQTEISIDRFCDPMGKYAGVKNICDLGAYRYPYKYYFECKEIQGNTLNFKSDIKEHQWNGLQEKQKVPGVLAGVLVWYFDHDETYFVDIITLRIMKENGWKSVNIKDIQSGIVKATKLPASKKRVLFSYDGKAILDLLEIEAKRIWI